jgi:hypothetical protein
MDGQVHPEAGDLIARWHDLGSLPVDDAGQRFAGEQEIAEIEVAMAEDTLSDLGPAPELGDHLSRRPAQRRRQSARGPAIQQARPRRDLGWHRSPGDGIQAGHGGCRIPEPGHAARHLTQHGCRAARPSRWQAH